MYGPPEDVKGECNAHLYIGDDYGDNRATMRCPLPKGHEGPHREEFMRGPDDDKKVMVTWEYDETVIPLKDGVPCYDCWDDFERGDMHEFKGQHFCGECWDAEKNQPKRKAFVKMPKGGFRMDEEFD